MQPINSHNLTREEQKRLLSGLIGATQHVRLDRERLRDVARRARPSFESGWIRPFAQTDEHYGAKLVELDGLDSLQYAFISASQVWLIWERDHAGNPIPLTMTIDGVRYVGSYTLAACHVRAIRRGILDANVLAEMTMQDVEEHYRDEASGIVKAQLLEERLANFNEVGRVLLEKYDGHFVNVLRKAERRLYRDDGSGLIQLLERDFPRSFGDWPLAKLPNVFTFMLLDLRDREELATEFNTLLRFEDLDQLEGGADYYRPWFFLRSGVFDISDEFRDKLRKHELIEPGSQMERDFRAMTISAMRLLATEIDGDYVEALRLLERETHAQALLRCRHCRVDISDEELPCPYRANCKATHEDHALMDCAFPLVLTSEY